MTDATDRMEAKPAWTRCPKCKTRLWNDRIDIEVHGQHCPADLKRDFKRALKELERRIDELEKRPEPVEAELVVAGPLVDFEHEAPWPGGEAQSDDGVTLDEEDEDPLPLGPVTRRSWLDDDDEDDEGDPGAIRASLR